MTLPTVVPSTPSLTITSIAARRIRSSARARDGLFTIRFMTTPYREATHTHGGSTETFRRRTWPLAPEGHGTRAPSTSDRPEWGL